MKDQRWYVIRCAGPEGEVMWSVVHRQNPMFVAVVSDRSVDDLDAVPLGAIHWAKQASATNDRTLLREALETIRARRGDQRPIAGADSPERCVSRSKSPRMVRGLRPQRYNDEKAK